MARLGSVRRSHLAQYGRGWRPQAPSASRALDTRPSPVANRARNRGAKRNGQRENLALAQTKSAPAGGLREPIMLRPEIVAAAEEFLKTHPAPASEAHVEEVLKLIEGLDTAMGLELLATVHGVARHNRQAACDWEVAATMVHNWSEHKRRAFPRDWIRVAWQCLHERGWMELQHA